MECENCGISDSEKEVRLSDTAPDTWVCEKCHELNPHHSDWKYLKRRPYNEYHEVKLYVQMSREAIVHAIDVLWTDINKADTDLENTSISDIGALVEYLGEALETEVMQE